MKWRPRLTASLSTQLSQRSSSHWNEQRSWQRTCRDDRDALSRLQTPAACKALWTCRCAAVIISVREFSSLMDITQEQKKWCRAACHRKKRLCSYSAFSLLGFVSIFKICPCWRHPRITKYPLDYFPAKDGFENRVTKRQQGLSSALGWQSDIAIVQIFLLIIWGQNSTLGIAALIPRPYRSVMTALSPVSWPCSRTTDIHRQGLDFSPKGRTCISWLKHVI